MADDDHRKSFYWGCYVPIDPTSRFPTSASITHVRNCECPGEDRDGVIMIILERAHYLHASNVVKYMIPVVNIMAKEAALKIGINLDKGVESLAIYEGKVEWTEEGVCVEVLGRGFTDEEFESLRELPKDQMLCSWLI